MALNPGGEGKKSHREPAEEEVEEECGGGGTDAADSSRAAAASNSNQNGDQQQQASGGGGGGGECGEDTLMSEQGGGDPDRWRKEGQGPGQQGLHHQAAERESVPPPGRSSMSPAGHGHGRPPGEELPLPRRSSFQIPRKTKGGKATGMYDFLPPDSRGFEDLKQILSRFYLDQSSRGTFTYCKARLIHNELLEKEFIEKRRAMKQEGRTEAELAESYCFLFPDKARLQWICEKGLSVGHSRNNILGNPASGVYLSRNSDLLQINPFEAGSYGDMIIFKVMRGRVKYIFDSMPKNAVEPTQKFDCHMSKNANRVSSLLSYRAFELTQQYFFEFAFEEIKARPRHVCPYAVLSFTYKGKDAASLAPLTPHRFNIPPQSTRGKCSYTVWSGPLMNKGQEMFHVCVRSSTRPYLPFKLPERLDLSRGMQLDQAKRKIPAVLFSWDTYSITREVMKCGMFCSLFEVVDGKGKPTNGSLAGLVHKLERDRMVLVQPLFDKGFLFLLTSTQMVNPNERWVRVEKSLQALFIFQEARTVAKYPPRGFDPVEPLLPPDLQPPCPLQPHMEPFLPALHYALFKLRTNPGKDLSSGVEHRAHEYLLRLEGGTVRPFTVPTYNQNLDERGNNYPAPRAKHNIEGQLRTYVHNPAHYTFALAKARGMVDKVQNQPQCVPVPMPIPVHVPGSMNMVSSSSLSAVGGPPLPPSAAIAAGPPEYSPVSDWGGSDMGASSTGGAAVTTTERPAAELRLLLASEQRSAAERLLLLDGGGGGGGGSGSSRRSRSGLSHSNGSQSSDSYASASTTQSQKDKEKYDKDKMKELLKLIHQHKKNITPGETGGQDQRRGGGEDPWDPHGLLLSASLEQERSSRPGSGEDPWDVVPHSLKRKMEAADGEWGSGGRGGSGKHPRLDPMSNGEPSRVPPTDESSAMDAMDGGANFNLAAVLKGMDMYDTDLRAAAGGGGANNDNSSVNETQRLLKILLATLNKAMTHSGIEPPSLDLELPGSSSSTSGSGGGSRSVLVDADLRKPREEMLLPPAAASSAPTANYAAEDMDCSPASPFSPGSPVEPSHTSDTPSWVIPIPIHQEWVQTAAVPTEPVAPVDGMASPKPVTSEVKKVANVKTGAAAALEVKKAEVMKAAPEVKKKAPVAEVKKPASPPPPRILMVEEPPQRPSISLDTILNQEVYSLTSAMRSLMHTQRVYYISQLPQRLPPQRHGHWPPPNRVAFSGFVAPYVTPAAGLVGTHVLALAERMRPLLPTPPPTPVAADPKVTSPPAHAHTTGSDLTSPNPPPVATTTTTTTTTPKTKAEPSHSKSARRPGGTTTARDHHRGGSSSSSKAKTASALTEAHGVSSEMYSPSRVTPGSPEQQQHAQTALLPPSGSALLANSLIGQLKPEVFSSLMEVFKDVTKNTVKFYIHSEQESNGSTTICTEIQEYLQSLGNRECVPQAFLENSSSMDKLLIIIQNTDIAAHVHKIPALVSLKKLSSVSFAGVDSLDDVKNHTYNELFVSGGFIVSDEFVLNPDLISQERLQALLSFLEQQSTPEHPWQWKVHCKSQKKLKELARLNSNAMGLLNLLTVYQKKHLVEFLPYHECDTASRQAPDLDCLVKLQAQHTQQRHLVFLTERPFEMFLQYSRNGIVIASIDDIMTSFHSLIGSIDHNDLPTPPSTVNDECVEAEDMSLDSDDGAEPTPHPAAASMVPVPPEPPSSSSSSSEQQQNQKQGLSSSSAVAPLPPSFAPPAEKQPPPLPPPPPENDEFRPPLPGGDTTATQSSGTTPGSAPLNPSLSAALSTALSQFNLQLAGTGSEVGGVVGGGMSPGGFAVNPHQSFLCPTASWGASYLSAAAAAAAAGVGAYASAVASAVASPVAYPGSPPQPPPPPPHEATTAPQEYPPRTPAPPPLPATTIGPQQPTAPPTTTSTLQSPAPTPSSLVSSVPPPPSLLSPAALSSRLASAPSLLTAPPSLLTAPPPSLLTGGVGPLGSNLASLPMEVKPPPPPHLMMLGHVYGSDPPPSTPPHGASPGSGLTSSSSAYGADMSGLHHHNSSPGGGGDNNNRTGASSSDASTMPGGALAHSGLLQATVGLGEWSSPHQVSPGSQGARTPADCSDSLGASCVGLPTTAGGPRGPGGAGAPLLHRPQLHHPTPHPLHAGGPYGQMDPHHHHHPHHRGALMGGPGSSSLGGGYRGRGVVPPALQWPRPGLGEGGGGPCNPWGYPMGRGRGQDYYTYSHNYSP